MKGRVRIGIRIELDRVVGVASHAHTSMHTHALTRIALAGTLRPTLAIVIMLTIGMGYAQCCRVFFT